MRKKSFHNIIEKMPTISVRLEENKLSIDYCRKKLGKRASNFSDKQLEQLRDFLYLLAEIEYQHYKTNGHEEESNTVYTRLD